MLPDNADPQVTISTFLTQSRTALGIAAAQSLLFAQASFIVLSTLLTFVPILPFSLALQIMQANLAQIRKVFLQRQRNRTLEAQNTENYPTTSSSPILSRLNALLANHRQPTPSWRTTVIETHSRIHSHILYQRFQDQHPQEDQHIGIVEAPNSPAPPSFPNEEKTPMREEKAKEKQEKHKFFP